MAEDSKASGDGAAGGGAHYDKLKAFLDHRMRVTVSDGRVIMGKFKCFDSAGNVFLFRAENYVPMDVALKETMAEKRLRDLQTVMIPGSHIVKCEIDKEPYPFN